MALNIQAHQNVASHADEFVKELLVLHDGMRLLVMDLLGFEVSNLKPPSLYEEGSLRSVVLQQLSP